MDYEKLHKDTITKLQQMVNSGNITVEVAREICAGEDERIRKDIITTLSIGVSCEESALHPGAYTTLKEAIAWLEKQDNTKLRKHIEIDIEIASNVLVKLLESDKFQKDVREHLFDKGDKDLSDIYDIYAEEAVKYVKALYKHLNK